MQTNKDYASVVRLLDSPGRWRGVLSKAEAAHESTLCLLGATMISVARVPGNVAMILICALVLIGKFQETNSVYTLSIFDDAGSAVRLP